MKLIHLIQDNPNRWKDILAKKKIKIKRDSDYPNLAIFNYDIMADFTDEIVKECRGVIIDMDNMHIVCRPFDKFCNYGESGADEIDWNTAKVQQKVDGSIMKLFWYDGEWKIATNGVINAFKANIGTSNTNPLYSNFGDLFTKAAETVGLDLERLDIANTYIFELISPWNRVVIDYGSDITLYHLGTRNNLTGEEKYTWIGVQQPKEYPLQSLEECIDAAKKLNVPGQLVKSEGFVVVDKNWKRIKIKSPEYVLVHHILPNGEISDEKIISNIRNGEIDEILVYIPSLQKRVDMWKDKINNFELQFKHYIIDCEIELQQMYESYLDIEKSYIRKDFAIKHQHDWFFSFAMGILFDDKELNLDSLSDKKYYQLISKMM